MVAVLAGCDAGRPADDDPTRGATPPAVAVLRVFATTGYSTTPFAGFPGSSAPIFAPLTEGQLLTGVKRGATLAVEFDRFLLPASVNRQAICVRTDGAPVEKLDDCVNPTQDFLSVEYDPVRRRALFRGAAFAASATYKLTLFVAREATDFGIRAFDGAPLDRKYEFLFQTDAEDPQVHPEPLHTPENYCAAYASCSACRAPGITKPDQATCFADSCPVRAELNVFSSSCVSGQCHLNSGQAAEGLSLDTLQNISLTAIRQTAHQTQVGAAAEVPTLSGQPFGATMPIVSPAFPGDSYAVYKAIAQPENHCALVGDCSGGTIDVGLLAEITRLKRAFVIADPMPPDPGEPGQGLLFVYHPVPTQTVVDDGLRTIADWIAWGAPLCTCKTIGGVQTCTPNPAP